MITFLVESWDQYYADPKRAALWQEHYDYLALAHEGRMAMSPDVRQYQMMALLGQLVCVVARERGEMVGYSLFLFKRHLHYSTLCAFEDSYFLTARCRKGLVGYRLIRATLREIWSRGCQRAYFMTKEFASIAKLFERLDGEKMDSVYCFWNPEREG